MTKTRNYDELPENSSREKLAADGRFFEKRAKAPGGRFFRDLPGRDDGRWYEKTAQLPTSSQLQVGGKTSKIKTELASTSATGAPVGASSASGGQEAAMGMNGSGEGLVNKEAKSPDENAVARLRGILARGEKPEGEGGREKAASADPADIGDEFIVPTGFHRPSQEQPEALEAGGERFHSTEAQNPNFSPKMAGNIRHPLVETGGLRTKKQRQMGKHAQAARFLGTRYGASKLAQDSAGFRQAMERAGGDYQKAMKAFGQQATEKAKEGTRWLTDPKNPERAAAATALAGLVGYRGLRALLRKGLRKTAPRSVTRTLGERVSDAARAFRQ